MKRIIYRVMTFLLVLSLLTGMFIAYAEMEAEKETGDKGGTPANYNFYLSMECHGVTDLATPREKETIDNCAVYTLTTITNTSGYPIYINVRNQAGTTVVGTRHEIASGTSAPTYFGVYYKSGYGNVGVYYRPSGQTSSSSPYGAYVQGNWIP